MIRRSRPQRAASHDCVPLRPGVTLPFLSVEDRYRVEMATESGRAKCAGCNHEFAAGNLRVGVYTKSVGDFALLRFHHFGCAYSIATRLQPGLFANIDRIAGFHELALREKDACVRLAARWWHATPSTFDGNFETVVKAAQRTKGGAGGASFNDLERSAALLRDVHAAVSSMATADLRQLILKNVGQLDGAAQRRFGKLDRASILQQATLLIAHGVPGRCDTCGGVLELRSAPARFHCTGSIDEFTACGRVYDTIPPLTKASVSEFGGGALSGKAQCAPVLDAAAVARAGLCAIFGTTDLMARAAALDMDEAHTFSGVRFSPAPHEKSLNSLLSCVTKIRSAGGEVNTTAAAAAAAVEGADCAWCVHVSGPDSAKSLSTHTVTEEWILESLRAGRALTFLEGSRYLVGAPPQSALQAKADEEFKKRVENSKAPKKKAAAPSESTFAGSTPIDPACSLANSDRAFVKSTDDGIELNATFQKVDLQTGLNSYYVVQVIEGAKSSEAVLFRRWGRLGDDMRSGQKEETMHRYSAATAFATCFHERTGVLWLDRKAYAKKAGFYHWVNQPPSQSDDGHDGSAAAPQPQGDAPATVVVAGTTVALEPPTQQLLDLLFDEKVIEKTMQTMQIDTTKMPLSGLTLSSVKRGEEVLKELESLLVSSSAPAAKSTKAKAHKRSAATKPDDDSGLRTRIVALSNRFYSFVPHSIDDTPAARAESLLDSPAKLGVKAALLDDLRSILFTKQTIKLSGADSRYASLRTELEWLNPSHEEAQMAITYAINTHGSTHNRFDVKNVWKMARVGEREQYSGKWGQNANRMLLWHGSRTTNWVNILAQGLRIAPPEAPSSGYMFGKGVYFADMFTKSANYCFANHGLLCLAEVALGTMQERTRSHYVTQLAPPYQSTYAIGASRPNPRENRVLPCGTVVPMGVAVRDSRADDLLYNEYIVYDTSQIHMRYLIEVAKK